MGEIPLNQWLGLDRHDRVRLRRLYPDTVDEGVYPWDERVRVTVPPHGSVLLEVESTPDAVRRSLATAPPNIPVERAFLSLEDLARAIHPSDLWRALGMPGRDNMPVF